MKRRTLLIVIVTLLGIGGLYLAAGPDFLPWMRNRPITEWSAPIVTYRVEIVHALDSTYRIIVHTSSSSKLKMVRTGDSSMAIRYDDGFLSIKPGDIYDYDSSLVKITGNKKFPLQIGTSRMLVRLPTRIDTSIVRVESEEWGLAVYSGK